LFGRPLSEFSAKANGDPKIAQMRFENYEQKRRTKITYINEALKQGRLKEFQAFGR
jgi:hypothetical protein